VPALAGQCNVGSASSGLGSPAAEDFSTCVSIIVVLTSRPGWPDVIFAMHDGEEIGPRMLARIAKLTGLTLDDL
jgi:hypothetical protein